MWRVCPSRLRPAGVARSRGARQPLALLPALLRDESSAYTPEETDRYLQAWSQPRAATAMINYYRSSVRTPPKKAAAALRRITASTLVIGGEGDRYLGPELAEPEHDDVPGLDRVERLCGASHWVHQDEAGHVNRLLTDFFAPPCQPRTEQASTCHPARRRPRGRALAAADRGNRPGCLRAP